MLTYEVALSTWIESLSSPTEAESRPVRDVVGRVLAVDVLADIDHPPFDTSAVDGWGIRFDSLGADGGELPVSSRIPAAPSAPAPLPAGSAVKVMTGAPVPAGVEAVVPVEEAEDRGERVHVAAKPVPGAHIRRAGEIFAAGVRLASAGETVTPRLAALLAAGSAGSVEVRRRPRVAILVTGDELVPAGTRPGPGQIRNSNGVFLAAAVVEAGGEVTSVSVASDVREELSDALRRLFDASPPPDLVVTSGGVSMGDWDLVAGTLAAIGAETLFHRVAIRPAKPTLAARRKGTAFLGLPGNPVSVSVAFELFARPAIRRLSGLAPLSSRSAVLEEPLRNRDSRLGFLDARLRLAPEGLRLRPLRSLGSHDLLSHAQANALVIAPPGADLPEGAAVEAIPLDPAEW